MSIFSKGGDHHFKPSRHFTTRKQTIGTVAAQRSKGARSFRGQKILQPGHPDALFSSKKFTTFSVVALKTQATNAVLPSK